MAMNVGDMKPKPKKGSVQRKKLENDAVELRKIVTLTYTAYKAFLNAAEKQARIKPPSRVRRAKKLPEHLDRAIIVADAYPERDLLYRRLANHCYKTSQMFLKSGDVKQAVKWMNLTLRFLRLSMSPKQQEADEKLEAELASLEKKIDEIKRQEEAKDAS